MSRLGPMGPGSVFNTCSKAMWWPMWRAHQLGCWLSWVGPYPIASKMSSWKNSDGHIGGRWNWRHLGYIVHGDMMETLGKMVSIDGKLIYCKTVKFFGIESLKVIAAQRHGRLDLPSAKECKKSFAQHGGPRAGCKPLDPSVSKTCHPVILQTQIFSTV